MNAVRGIAMIWFGCSLMTYGGTQADLYSSNQVPESPEPFPAIYQNYQILPGTISPDQRYALIYPKRSLLYGLKDYGLFLVALKPFRVLSQLPLGNSNLAENVRCGFSSNWAKDSSAVVMIVESRWGAEKVSVVALKNGEVTRRTELTSRVRKEVKSSFLASKAPRYNDHYDFVFEEDSASEDGSSPRQGWDLDNAGHVLIDCICSTDPKGIDPQGWTVKFTGIWDIGKGTFLKKNILRLPSPDLR